MWWIFIYSFFHSLNDIRYSRSCYNANNVLDILHVLFMLAKLASISRMVLGFYTLLDHTWIKLSDIINIKNDSCFCLCKIHSMCVRVWVCSLLKHVHCPRFRPFSIIVISSFHQQTYAVVYTYCVIEHIGFYIVLYTFIYKINPAMQLISSHSSNRLWYFIDAIKFISKVVTQKENVWPHEVDG